MRRHRRRIELDLALDPTPDFGDPDRHRHRHRPGPKVPLGWVAVADHRLTSLRSSTLSCRSGKSRSSASAARSIGPRAPRRNEAVSQSRIDPGAPNRLARASFMAHRFVRAEARSRQSPFGWVRRFPSIRPCTGCGYSLPSRWRPSGGRLPRPASFHRNRADGKWFSRIRREGRKPILKDYRQLPPFCRRDACHHSSSRRLRQAESIVGAFAQADKNSHGFLRDVRL